MEKGRNSTWKILSKFLQCLNRVEPLAAPSHPWKVCLVIRNHSHWLQREIGFYSKRANTETYVANSGCFEGWHLGKGDHWDRRRSSWDHVCLLKIAEPSETSWLSSRVESVERPLLFPLLDLHLHAQATLHCHPEFQLLQCWQIHRNHCRRRNLTSSSSRNL